MDPNSLPDMTQIMKMAQQVASQIEPPKDLKKKGKLDNKDMENMLGQITKSVTNMVSNGELSFDEEQKNNKNQSSTESKISLDNNSKEKVKSNDKKKKRYVEVESASSDNDDPTILRTPDMTFTVSVTLEDLYKGSKKKLAIRRQIIDKDGSYSEEKKKLAIKIEPGMIEEQVIRFNRMADEKQGYETGDVVVNLDVEEHSHFVRDGNNLLVEKEVSISEIFKPEIYISHLDNRIIKVSGEYLNLFSEEDDLLKKISGEGMPIQGENGKFGDMFIRFKCVDNSTISKEEIFNKLSGIFPIKNIKPEIEEGVKIVEKSFEMVTESDLEFLESEDSDEYSDYSDEYSSEGD